MNVKQLKNILNEVSNDAEVQLDIEVESGFYDVPARHAGGKLVSSHWDNYAEHNRLILRGKK